MHPAIADAATKAAAHSNTAYVIIPLALLTLIVVFLWRSGTRSTARRRARREAQRASAENY